MAEKGLLRTAGPDSCDHVHPDYWEGLGFRPVYKEAATAEFADKFG